MQKSAQVIKTFLTLVFFFKPYLCIFRLVFIYTMPGYNCSIKERMLYSSCKNGLVESLQHKGIQIDKRVKLNHRSIIIKYTVLYIINNHYSRSRLTLSKRSLTSSWCPSFIRSRTCTAPSLPSPRRRADRETGG